MDTKKVLALGTMCAVISSSLCFVNAGSMKDSANKRGSDTTRKQSPEKIAKREEIKKKFEALNKKLKDAGAAIANVSDANAKIALTQIHEYLIGMAELRQKGAERMKGFMNEKDGKGRRPMGSRKNEGFPPTQEEDGEFNQ
jgi:hypothetical protein